MFIDASLRSKSGQEYLVPSAVTKVYNDDRLTYVPVINLSDRQLILTNSQFLVRAYPFHPRRVQKKIMGVDAKKSKQ